MAKKQFRTKDLQKLVSGIRSGEFGYEEKGEKLIDFARYNEAQVNELADMFDMIREIVDMAATRVRGMKRGEPGRPSVPDADIVKVLLVQSYFGVSNRVASGHLRLFRGILGIDKNFSYKTIERGYDPERTKVILDEVFKITNELGNASETECSVDGTGDPTTIKINYESRRSAQHREEAARNIETDAFPKSGTKHNFQYSVLGAGVSTKIIAGFSTTGDHSIGELSHFPSVMQQIFDNCPQMDAIHGDGLYAARTIVGIVSRYDVIPYFLPKSNATLKSYGVFLWKRMCLALMRNPQLWLREYHKRSIGETVNSMIKRREPTPIRKRLERRKDTEERLKINVHNVRQYSYLTYLAPHLVKELGG